MSSNSSSSSRIFSYSATPMTTAIFSPWSLKRNCGLVDMARLFREFTANEETRATKTVSSSRKGLLLVAGGSHFEDGQEGFLRDVDLADALHALFAFFLLFEEFALAGNVAAVALGQNVLADGRNRLAGDHSAADGRLDRHLEHLPRNELSQARHQFASAFKRHFAVNDQRQRIDRFARDQHIQFDEVGFAVARKVIVQRSVAARNAFQSVVKVQHDFVQRQFVSQHDACGRQVLETLLRAALVLAKLQNSADGFFV